MAKSVETPVKQIMDAQIRNLGWDNIASENETLDTDIDSSLKKNLSKQGGTGGAGRIIRF